MLILVVRRGECEISCACCFCFFGSFLSFSLCSPACSHVFHNEHDLLVCISVLGLPQQRTIHWVAYGNRHLFSPSSGTPNPGAARPSSLPRLQGTTLPASCSVWRFLVCLGLWPNHSSLFTCLFLSLCFCVSSSYRDTRLLRLWSHSYVYVNSSLVLGVPNTLLWIPLWGVEQRGALGAGRAVPERWWGGR